MGYTPLTMRTTRFVPGGLALGGTLAALSAVASAGSPLIVHEWGTFTCLQDSKGATIAGINSDDEPVPDFVHRLWDQVLVASAPEALQQATLSQGAPFCHPDVTMRMETPVIYFYPPREAGELTIDVHVRYRGGWLTEYYPWAETKVLSGAGSSSMQIATDTWCDLTWKDLRVGYDLSIEEWPETEEPVWLAPRKVPAAPVATETESEQYLFYRGVGHANTPLRAERVEGGLALCAHASAANDLPLGHVWALDVQPDGRAWFTKLACPVRLDAASGSPVAYVSVPDETAGEHRPHAQGELRDSMHAGLVAEGLYPNEAEAMLNTWRISYFESPGLRVFYCLPGQWTESVLPLSIEAPIPSVTTRVMVGRLECVTTWQEDLLDDISQAPETADALDAYADLGRFRSALILHGAELGDDGLKAFADRIELEAAELKTASPAQRSGQ